MVFILEKDHRFAYRLSGNGSMLGRSESSPIPFGQLRGCGSIMSIANFTRRILVTASSMRDIGTVPSCTSSFRSLMNSLYPRDHHHVHAGIDGDADRGLIIPSDLVDGVVVGNQEAFETDLLLQHLREQAFRAGDLDAVPTVIGRHNGPDACAARCEIALHVHAAQSRFVYARVALIEISRGGRARAERRAAVADVMFRAGQYG